MLNHKMKLTTGDMILLRQSMGSQLLVNTELEEHQQLFLLIDKAKQFINQRVQM